MRIHGRTLLPLFCLQLLATWVQAQTAASNFPVVTEDQKAKIIESYGKLPLAFEANQGQSDPQVKFLARGPGYGLLLTPTEAMLSVAHSGFNIRGSALSPVGSGRRVQSTYQGSMPQDTSPGVVVQMKLLNTNPKTIVSGEEELTSRSHYFIGNDPTKWRTNVRQFAKVRYRDVYPGVDLVYYSRQQQLEYDFVLKAGVDPGKILFGIDGTEALRFEHGDIVLLTSVGNLYLRSPHLYQEENGNRRAIRGRYVLHNNNTVGFDIDSYDRTKELVIDPILAYSTYVNQNQGAFGIALDAARNAYVVGLTSLNGRDVVITKINADGTSVLYTSYLGGTLDEWAPAIAVDSTGNAYVTGSTQSTDFPTKNTIQSTNHGYYDAFVTKISPDGSKLVYSTYIGGSVGDFGASIAVDKAGNAYVAGVTGSSDFPLANALQTSASGQGDAFVAKINPTGSGFVYSTYLTGSNGAYASAVAADSKGNAYVTGGTESADFPTSHALQPYHGGRDAFLSKINPGGSAFVYSTFLGGSGEEDPGAIALDSGSNVYVVGSTTSTDFPTVNPIQETNAGGWDVFVTKVNAGGSALVYSTYLGGSGNDRAYSVLLGGGTGAGIAVDLAGNAYITGSTESNDFPVQNAIQTTFGGKADAFIAGINAGGDALIYSTNFGGPGAESAAGLAVDSRGSAYVAGAVGSSVPITPAAVNQSYNGAFLAKIAPNTFVSGLPAKTSIPIQLVGTTGAPKNLVLNNNGTAPLTITRIYFTGANASDFSQGNTCGSAVAAGAKCTIAVSFSPSASTLRQAALVISDSDPASPQTVALSGYGTVVLFSPAKLLFGNHSVGTSASQSVTLTNTGSTALKITSITVTGAAAADFSQTNNCGTGIAASGQCKITVTFKPTATGTRSASVAVKDSGGGSGQTIVLSGTGT
jgi:centrosomal CEP192-like protein/beta-propeller repeat-containing protein